MNCLPVQHTSPCQPPAVIAGSLRTTPSATEGPFVFARSSLAS